MLETSVTTGKGESKHEREAKEKNGRAKGKKSKGRENERSKNLELQSSLAQFSASLADSGMSPRQEGGATPGKWVGPCLHN